MSESEGAAKGREMARKLFDLALPTSKSIHLKIVGHKDSTHTITIIVRTRAQIEQQTLEELDNASIIAVHERGTRKGEGGSP